MPYFRGFERNNSNKGEQKGNRKVYKKGTIDNRTNTEEESNRVKLKKISKRTKWV